MPAGPPKKGKWKDSFEKAIEDAMSDVPIGEVLVIDKVEVRKKNPIHEYRVVLGTNP